VLQQCHRPHRDHQHHRNVHPARLQLVFQPILGKLKVRKSSCQKPSRKTLQQQGELQNEQQQFLANKPQEIQEVPKAPVRGMDLQNQTGVQGMHRETVEVGVHLQLLLQLQMTPVKTTAKNRGLKTN
jgi:hypothetical protein